MKQGIAIRIGSVACAAALGLSLIGCGAGANASATEAQQANRTYMSRVNETMVELDDSLDQFVDAVSRGDVVNMRTQADNAYKMLDKLSGIEAPEELKSVRESYVTGTTKLKEALDGYIALYTELSKNDASFDKAAYDAKIAEIQSLYDEGVAALQKGDETAAGTSQASTAPGSSGSAESAAAQSSQSSSDAAQSSSQTQSSQSSSAA